MKLFGIRIESLSWVLYPVAVAAILIFGTNYLFSSGELSQVKLASRQGEIEAQQKVANDLRTKLEQLKKINREQGLEEMRKLTEAMPASRKVWLTLTDVMDAASISGIIFDSFEARVGDVVEASGEAVLVDNPKISAELEKQADAGKTKESAVNISNSPLSLTIDYEQTDFPRLVKMLAELERDLPLLKIKNIDYAERETELVLEAAWLPWETTLKSDPTIKLPDYKAEVDAALEKLKQLELKETES